MNPQPASSSATAFRSHAHKAEGVSAIAGVAINMMKPVPAAMRWRRVFIAHSPVAAGNAA